MTDGWGNTATDTAAPASMVVLREMLRDSSMVEKSSASGTHKGMSTAVAVDAHAVPGCPVDIHMVFVHTL